MLSFMHRFIALEQGIRSIFLSRFRSITTRVKKKNRHNGSDSMIFSIVI
jgi:hypothetical protein